VRGQTSDRPVNRMVVVLRVLQKARACTHTISTPMTKVALAFTPKRSLVRSQYRPPHSRRSEAGFSIWESGLLILVISLSSGLFVTRWHANALHGDVYHSSTALTVGREGRSPPSSEPGGRGGDLCGERFPACGDVLVTSCTDHVRLV
jgi:hypothetical protein